VNIIDFLKSLPHVEPDADYLNAFDYYPFLNALAKDLRAAKVLEIGVRFGYSAVAFIFGNPVEEYAGVDNDLYDATGSAKSRENLEYLKNIQPLNFALFKKDTQTLTDLAFLDSRVFNFIHIDGDHSYEGALTDMKNFWNVLAVGGHMLVDDSIFYASVNKACIDFAGLIGEPCYNVRSFRGTWVFLKTNERSFAVSQSTVNETARAKPVDEADIFKKLSARHAGWSGPLLLLKDGTFRGGLINPDGRWNMEGDLLTLAWSHWPASVLRLGSLGSYSSTKDSDSLTLQEDSWEVEDGHLGGNVHGGDAMTFYPELWKWMRTLFSARSVLDIGCGEGHALVEFGKDGIRVIGIDGLRRNVIETTKKRIDCLLHDFTKGAPALEEEFDLGWSCEFVEHVEARFLDNILAAFKKCRIVAMTHALPMQGGHHHVNCQPAEYWIEKMAGAGFMLLSRETAESRLFYPDTYWGRTGLIFARNHVYQR